MDAGHGKGGTDGRALLGAPAKESGTRRRRPERCPMLLRVGPRLGSLETEERNESEDSGCGGGEHVLVRDKWVLKKKRRQAGEVDACRQRAETYRGQ